jgi:hypothetical protein
MNDEIKLLQEKLYEAYLHKKRLKSARHKLKYLMPLDSEKYNELDDIFISIIDQMLFRFTKLQNTLGEKVFPEILICLKEPVKKMSFIDRLNRLEELEILDKNEWIELRNDGNEIAHEYSYNEENVIENINFVYNKSKKLIEIYDEIYNFTKEKFNIKLELK